MKYLKGRQKLRWRPDVQLSDNQQAAEEPEVCFHVSQAATAVLDHQGSAGDAEDRGCLLCGAGRTRLSLSRLYASKRAWKIKLYTQQQHNTANKSFGARRFQISTVIISGFERRHSGTHSYNLLRVSSNTLKLFGLDP